MEQTNSTHSYIDLMVTIFSLVTAEILPHLNLHIHLPPIIMEATQEFVWGIGGMAGLLTILNFLGYTPRWLQWVKNKLKNK